MDYSEIVFKGILTGLGVSAPIGPIGILCISRSINKGFLSGFFTGLGAVVPNIIYTFLAVAGIAKFLIPLIEKYPAVIVISGVYIIYLGVKTGKKTIERKSEKIKSAGYAEDFLSTFLIMITNPATIISYLIVISGVGFSSLENSAFTDVIFVTVSVVTGAIIWWLFLSIVSVKFGSAIFKNKIKMMNQISGSVIILFGILLIVKSII
ncbi:MAG: LysE family translocator [Rhodothermaceae bacterium]